MEKAYHFEGVWMVLILVIMAFVFCGDPKESLAAPQVKKAVILRFAHGEPATVLLGRGAQRFADRFNERAKGAYRVEIYPAGQMGKFETYLNLCRTGAIEIAEVTNMNAAGEAPALDIMLPFLFNNQEAQYYAGFLGEKVIADIWKKTFNQKPFMQWGFELQDIIANSPVRTLSDMKGKKVKVGGGITRSKSLSLWGAAPVSIAGPETYEALQRKIADGCIGMMNSVIAFKWYEILKHYTISGMFSSFNSPFTINLDVWNSLPKNIQDILTEEGKAADEWLYNATKEEREKMIKTLKDNKVEVYILPPDESAKWREVVKPVYDLYLKAAGPDGKKLLDFAMEANKKYSGK